MPIERFVLIDDNQHDNLIHQLALKRSGFAGEVLTFDWAPDALDFLVKDQISMATCVLLDIHMPVLPGPALLAEMERAVAPRAPLHLLLAIGSAQPTEYETVRGVSMLSGYFQKPLSQEQIVAVLDLP